MMDFLRIIAYAVIAAGCTYLFFEDHARRSRAKWVWLALGIEHGAVLALLAMDVRQILGWMDSRWMLTPVALIAAITLAAYAAGRYIERRRFHQQVEDAFYGSHRQTFTASQSRGGAAPPTVTN